MSPALLLHERGAPVWAIVPADVQHRHGSAEPVCAGPPPDAPGSGGKDAGKGEPRCRSGITIYRLDALSLLEQEVALPALTKQRLVFYWVVRLVVLQSPEERPKVVAVRRHVLWWRPHEQLGFLCSLSKFIEGRRHLKESLNARAAAVLPGE